MQGTDPHCCLDRVDCRPFSNFSETGKNLEGPVDGHDYGMLGCPMEEKAKLEFTIKANWRREDGSIATTQLGTLDRGACRSAENVGLQLADAKPILGRLQEIVVSEQLQR